MFTSLMPLPQLTIHAHNGAALDGATVAAALQAARAVYAGARFSEVQIVSVFEELHAWEAAGAAPGHEPPDAEERTELCWRADAAASAVCGTPVEVCLDAHF